MGSPRQRGCCFLRWAFGLLRGRGENLLFFSSESEKKQGERGATGRLAGLGLKSPSKTILGQQIQKAIPAQSLEEEEEETGGLQAESPGRSAGREGPRSKRAHPSPAPRTHTRAGPRSIPTGRRATPGKGALTHCQAPSAAPTPVPTARTAPPAGPHGSRSARSPLAATKSPGPGPVFKGFGPRRRRLHSPVARPSWILSPQPAGSSSRHTRPAARRPYFLRGFRGGAGPIAGGRVRPRPHFLRGFRGGAGPIAAGRVRPRPRRVWTNPLWPGRRPRPCCDQLGAELRAQRSSRAAGAGPLARRRLRCLRHWARGCAPLPSRSPGVG